MQAVFQRFTDTSVSKTINLVNDSTPADIAKAYMLAFQTGCKGVTVFRDDAERSRFYAPDSIQRAVENGGGALIMQSGCQTCVSCG